MNHYVRFLITLMLRGGSNAGVGKSIVEFAPAPLFTLPRFAIAIAAWPVLRLAKVRRAAAISSDAVQ
ncbi:hypothetical protein [Paraburkholderia fungorum]|uniref:hypothetical protein n=1 Tax=Paraburkholderia fungorum TaxID=134537 RepID=UPI0011EA70EB